MGAGSAPKPQKLPTPPPVQVDVAPEVLQAREDVRRAAQQSAGRGGTILSAPLTPYQVGGKSLLGGAT